MAETYNWSNMVTITVPKGLSGWQQRGEVRLNGRHYRFPVGEETQVPEPVAEVLNRMIAIWEANKPTGATGTSGWDAVIEIENNSCSASEFNQENTRLTGMTHAELLAALLANEAPRILMRQQFFYGDGYACTYVPIKVQAGRTCSPGEITLTFYCNGGWYAMTITETTITTVYLD